MATPHPSYSTQARHHEGLWARPAENVFKWLIGYFATLGNPDPQHWDDRGVSPIVQLVFVPQAQRQRVAARS